MTGRVRFVCLFPGSVLPNTSEPFLRMADLCTGLTYIFLGNLPSAFSADFWSRREFFARSVPEDPCAVKERILFRSL